MERNIFFKAALLISIIALILLINDLVLMNKVEEDRDERIVELEAQMKNLQSRINLNASVIDDKIINPILSSTTSTH